MSEYNTFIVVIGVIGIIQWILVLMFYFFHIRKYQSNPVYHIRKPTFWSVCLCIGCLQITLRSITTYLLLNAYIQRLMYYTLNSFNQLLFGFSFPFGRYLYISLFIELCFYYTPFPIYI